MLEQLVAKLRPDRFTGMSPKMASIVAYVLDVIWTEPHLVDLNITSDGLVMGTEALSLHGVLIGCVDDLDRNWSSLLVAADLTDAEYAFAMTRYHDQITDWRKSPELRSPH